MTPAWGYSSSCAFPLTIVCPWLASWTTQGFSGPETCQHLNFSDNIISATTNTRLYYGIHIPPTAVIAQLTMDGNDIPAAKFDVYNGGAVSHRNGKQALTFTTLPARSTWAAGDIAYLKQSGQQLGVAGSRYLLTGWTRITNGIGNVLNTDWYENRVLTGN